MENSSDQLLKTFLFIYLEHYFGVFFLLFCYFNFHWGNYIFNPRGILSKKRINKKEPDEKISGLYDYHWEKKNGELLYEIFFNTNQIHFNAYQELWNPHRMFWLCILDLRYKEHCARPGSGLCMPRAFL